MSTSSADEGRCKSTLFVRNIPYTASSQCLQKYFCEIGPLRSCFIVGSEVLKEGEKSSGKKHKGFGFVQFAVSEDAAKAVDFVKENKFSGRVLQAELAMKKNLDENAKQKKTKVTDESNGNDVVVETKEKEEKGGKENQEEKEEKAEALNKKFRLIIRNLPFSVTAPKLKKFLQRPLLELSMIKKKGRFSGFAFCHFENNKDALWAMKELNGKNIDGRPVALDYALAKSKYEEAMKSSGKTEDAVEDENIDAEEGSEQERTDEEDDQELEDDAEGLEDELEENSDDLADEIEATEQKEEKVPHSKAQYDDDTTVFIRNISFESTEKAIYDLFSKFGSLNYAKLVMKNGKSWGAAFVNFKEKSAYEECLKAAAVSLNISDKIENSILNDDQGIILEGRKLTVTPSVNREKASELRIQKLVLADKRNLQLIKRGIVEEGTPAAKNLTKEELEKHSKALEDKRKKLKNPNFFISKTRLSLRNLPVATSEADLSNMVKSYFPAPQRASLKQVKIVRSKERTDAKGVQRSMGYGFIEFNKHEDALKVLNSLYKAVYIDQDPAVFGGRKVLVEFAVENKVILEKRDKRKLSSTEDEKKANDKYFPKKQRTDKKTENSAEKKSFDKKPFVKKPLERNDKKSFDRNDKKPFVERKSIDKKSFDRNDKKPFVKSYDKKPFDRKSHDKKSFDRDSNDRKPFIKSYDKKSFVDRKSSFKQKPSERGYHNKKRSIPEDNKRSFGDKKSFANKKPFSNDRKKFKSRN